MKNFKFVVRYEGTEFHGWQTQPGLRTVQESLETAIKSITGEPKIYANCSGRTDSGVHAHAQVCNFYSACKLPTDKFVKAVNAKLDRDVAVLSCEEMDQSFDANKDAIAKRYRYVIDDGRIPDPFLRRFAYQPRRNVEVEPMHRAAQCLLGRHDFRCFETEWPNRMTSIRTIQEIAVERVNGAVQIEVQGDGFLYNMVRAIAGTLYQIGRRYWPEEKMREVLEGMDRRDAGPTAPAHGLFMLWVRYNI